MLRSNFVRSWTKALSFDFKRRFNGCCWPFKFAFVSGTLCRSPPFSHFDPFGTSFCEAGAGRPSFRTSNSGFQDCGFAKLTSRLPPIRNSNPQIYKDPSQPSSYSWRPAPVFDLTVPTLIPKSRRSLQREAFNVSKYYCFSIGYSQLLQRCS